MSEYHDDFTDLLGAYALDAVDADDRSRVEDHLVDCPRCRAEVAEHREVAAYLAQSGADAPEGVWDKIAAELEPQAPPMRMTILPTGEAVSARPEDGASRDGGAEVASIAEAPSRRGTVRTRTMVAVLAVAACLVLVLGAVAVIQSQDGGTTDTEQILADAKLKVDLTGEGGDAQVAIDADGEGHLILDDVPAPPEGDVYQLWGQVDGTILSLGTFGGSEVVPFSVDPSHIGDIELFAITQEAAPGVVASEQPAMMAGKV